MLRNRKIIFIKNYSSATPPILPPSTILDKSLTGIIRIDQNNKSSKRRYKRQNGGIGSGSGIGNPNGIGNSNGILPYGSLKYGSNWRINGSSDEFINLFSIYGNILAKNPELLVQFKSKTNFINYPIDSSLLKLFENSVKFWYENGGGIEGKKGSISFLSLKAPSRSTTWELAKHLAVNSGKSHLAIIPFQMFFELIQICYNNPGVQQEQGSTSVLGSVILSKFTGNVESNRKSNGSSFASDLIKNLTTTDQPPISSKCVIHVCEYLFGCIEASLGSMGQKSSDNSETFTILLDGVEEYLKSRKGGDIVLRDLMSWANLFETSGRRVMFGHRALDSEESVQEDEAEPSPEEDSINSSSLINAREKKPKRKDNNVPPGAFQMMTHFLLNATAGNQAGNDEGSNPITNVVLNGSTMRLLLTPPKTDKQHQLKYNQIISEERKKDRFDANIWQLKQVAKHKWNVRLDLNLKSKYDFPSNHSEIWGKLSLAGRGLLTKERLTRDEVNEIIMSILGESRQMNVNNLTEAIDGISRIRHDPSKFSTEDLSNFLSERQVSLSSLTKYEKRFINCISTSTTQTHFKDITLPSETMKTLKSLTTLPLTHPELFTQGILKSSLTGVLLFGPPGTGKTMLARAVAQESGATFLAVNMSNIFDMYVGEGEKNVKGMFSLARKLSPTIIFIDEIDALLERRSSISGRSSRLEIVNEFMSQWDGLSSNLNSGVIVMGATNRPSVLDDAVLRRLPRRILIDLPDSQSRHEIVKKLLKENLCENSLLAELPLITSKMNFYSGSDLKNVSITAALKAACRVAETPGSSTCADLIITRSDFEEAILEVPASLSDQMESLTDLRRWNQMYGETKKGEIGIKKFGFA